jgi:dolichol-phosphate mannosyltransferase
MDSRTQRPAPASFSRPVLVTGAAGFIGANLVRHYAARGARVVAMVHDEAPVWRLENLPDAVEQVVVDVCDAREVRDLLITVRPQVVLHCAAFGAYPDQNDAERIHHVNYDGVRYLLDAARHCDGLHAFVQMGTSSEYGINCRAPREDAPTVPDSDYAVSKVAATALVRFYALKHAVPAWVLRLYSVYGPYEDASRLVPRLLAEAKKGRLPPLVDPHISRDYLYVRDVCTACDALLERAGRGLAPGEIFNVGSGRKTTLEEIVAITRGLFAVPVPPEWGSMPNRRWDHPDWYADPLKASAMLGWRATTMLEEGLRATSRWMDREVALLERAREHSVGAVG